ncbi:YkvA family protein [Larsenimonas suaedae]|uniref:YkvA family protein n=1 Tax=Larsenimonas suaedae TaxID=1851019 RepID=A0ABU1GYU2_9GAMM|nr:YkvA family protein [Larsenimonas suaedae]MCM2971461.1 YkvA family protein [Larsenimonas suaedae]MDR5896717.1 YkvA family protein [Larsenimonas suaedae]
MKKAKGGMLSRLLGGRSRLLFRIVRAVKTYGLLLRDWWSGSYRPLPKRATALMVLTLVYIVSPFDLIPDFILGWGWLDDLFIGGWLLTRLDESLEDYRQWRAARPRDA